MDARYRKSERLLKRPDFLRVQGEGQRYRTPRMVILFMPSAVCATRLGLTVSTKVGSAVVRNRVKRRLREIYRQNRAQWPESMDIVIIARKAAADAEYSVLDQDISSWLAWLSRRDRSAHPS